MAVKLSIVMPVFNHPEELRTMLDSILQNTFQDWELWAVDDGSQQETLSVLDGYAGRDERIRFVRRERMPKGAQTCRNIGLEQAKGEYIIFFDSDDYITPSCFAQRVSEMDNHPELDFMVFRNGIFADGKFDTYPTDRCYGYPIYGDDIAAFCARTLPFIVWSNIYRTEALRKIGITWDDHLLSLQDGDFNLQTLLAGLQYSYAQNPPDYGYRIAGNEGSISKKRSSPAHLDSHLYSVEKNYQAVQNKFGNKYNRALYHGALFVYIMAFATEANHQQALKLAGIVARYSPGYGRLFLAKVKMHHCLRRFLPDSLAKKIVMADYSLLRRWQQRKLKRLKSEKVKR